jgi:hypothetical protein
MVSANDCGCATGGSGDRDDVKRQGRVLACKDAQLHPYVMQQSERVFLCQAHQHTTLHHASSRDPLPAMMNLFRLLGKLGDNNARAYGWKC